MREMRRVLDASPAGKLGFVLTGVSPDDEYGYGAYYSYGDRKRQRQAAKMSRG
jgi:hypothetical protein